MSFFFFLASIFFSEKNFSKYKELVLQLLKGRREAEVQWQKTLNKTTKSFWDILTIDAGSKCSILKTTKRVKTEHYFRKHRRLVWQLVIIQQRRQKRSYPAVKSLFYIFFVCVRIKEIQFEKNFLPFFYSMYRLFWVSTQFLKIQKTPALPLLWDWRNRKWFLGVTLSLMWVHKNSMGGNHIEVKNQLVQA